MAVGEHAFMDCTSLTTLMIPDGVVTIGESAFRRLHPPYQYYNSRQRHQPRRGSIRKPAPV